MWPHASTDLNPLDFSVWSMLKSKVSSVTQQSVDAFKRSILREWAKIPQETLRSPVGNFRQGINS